MQSETVITIKLPTEIFDEYSKQAKTNKKSLDAFISDKLGRTAAWPASTKPLYFSDEQRRTLETLLGKNFKDAEDVIQYVQRVLTIKLNGTEIPIKPNLLTRLKTRCFGTPFDMFLSQTVQNELERFVGLR